MINVILKKDEINKYFCQNKLGENITVIDIDTLFDFDIGIVCNIKDKEKVDELLINISNKDSLTNLYKKHIIQIRLIKYFNQRIIYETNSEKISKLINIIDDLVCKLIVYSINGYILCDDIYDIFNECKKTNKIFSLVKLENLLKNYVHENHNKEFINKIIEGYNVLIKGDKIKDISTVTNSLYIKDGFNSLLLKEFIIKADENDNLNLKKYIMHNYNTPTLKNKIIRMMISIHKHTLKTFDWFENMLIADKISGHDKHTLSLIIKYVKEVKNKTWPQIEPIICKSLSSIKEYCEEMNCDIMYKPGVTKILNNKFYRKWYIGHLKKILTEDQMKKKMVDYPLLITHLI